MRKLKYIFWLTASLVLLAGCLKSGNPIPGPQGAQGSTGSPGGDFLPIKGGLDLGSASNPMNVGSGPVYTTDWVFSNYNPNLTYMLTAYVSRENSANPTWYKLPYVNVYETGTPPGDVLYATLKYDTVEISYYNPSAAWPDSTLNCSIIIIPQQQ